MKQLQNPHHLTSQPSGWDQLFRLSSRLKPEQAFLWFALLLGMSLLVIVPPFQAPDEQHHFYRAYQVSEGIMVGEHFRMEHLPKSLKYAWEVTNRGIAGHPDRKIAAENILSAFRIPLNPDDRTLIASFAAPYSPHYYFPQALGIIVGRKLGLGPLALLYLGRLCTLVFCIWIFYLSIKKTPILKWVFCLLAATPISISLAASCSQDAVINGLAFLFTASVLDLTLSPEKEFTAGTFLLPAVVGALLAPAKGGAYAPMLAFFLFIPVRKAGTWTRYLALVTLAVLPGAVTLASWTILAQHQLLPIVDQASGPDKHSLLFGIWEAPLQYLELLAKTTTGLYKGYVAQFIGVLGWQDTILPRSIILAYLALVFTSAVLEDPAKSRLRLPSKIIVGLVVVLSYVFILTTHYLAFSSPPGSPVIHGLLGRYLIPLGPAFFLLLHSNRQIFRSHFSSLHPVIIVALMSLVVPGTLFSVVNRYYGGKQPTWRMSFDLVRAHHAGQHVMISSPDDFYQTFVCPADGLTGVSVSVVDAGLTPDEAINGYKFVLRNAVSGDVLREVGIQPFTLKNRGYLDILFHPIRYSKNKKYTFTIFPTEKAAKIPISVPLSEPNLYPEGETIVHGRKIARSVVFELIFRSSARPDD
jgi:uncharacterized membrane protein